jgi:hypothetical protein
VAIRDLTLEQAAPPAVRGDLPRLAKALTVEALRVSAGPSPHDPSTHLTDIQAVDLAAQGYADEAGNFIARSAPARPRCAARPAVCQHVPKPLATSASMLICLMLRCRLHDRLPTHRTLALSSTPSTPHTPLAVANVAMGHACLLRALALLLPGTDDPPPPPAPAPALQPIDLELPPPRVATTAIDLRDCRLVWKYQPAVAQRCSLPAALHDFLSLHEDIASLDLPHLHLRLPLDGAAAAAELGPSEEGAGVAGSGGSAGASPRSGHSTSASSAAPSPRPSAVDLVVARDVVLHVATVGYPGRPSLPVLQLPRLQLTCTLAPATRSLQLSAPSLDLGAHPSHLSAAAAAVQLYNNEMELLTREPPDTSTGEIGEPGGRAGTANPKP